MEKPFAAYVGDAPYVFVSYSHRDARFVYPELSWLQTKGFNIWYDDGIRAGHNWADDLAAAVQNSALMLFFITPNSVASQHCQDEVNLALNREKPLICVYFEHAVLTPGLELRLSSHQAIARYELKRENYEARLVAVLNEQLAHQTSSIQSPLDPNVPTGHYPTNPQGHTTPNSQAIAVLPFVNRSSDPENEYFSDGMSEEILNALVKTNSIPVIARTSSFSFKGLNLAVHEIAAKLNVGYVLEGSVQKAGNSIRVTAQLIRADSAVQIWSERFDRELQNVFALQDEIAHAIVHQIEESIGPTLLPPLRTEVSSTAYDLFLRAQHHIRQVTLADQDKAIELLKLAVELESNFADGWAYLGWAYTGYLAIRAPVETAKLAKPALARALSLDPDNPLALAVMGYTQATVDYRWHEGEAMMRKAANLAPGDTVVQMTLGIYLYATFQIPEARRVMSNAYRLDPLSVLSVSWYADILDASGRQQDAQRVLNAFIDTGVPREHNLMASTWMRMGEMDKAEDELHLFRQKWGGDSGTLCVLEYNLARMRNSMDAARLYDELSARLERGEYMTYWWGDDSNLYKRVKAAYENRWVGVVQLIYINPKPQLVEFKERMNLSLLDGKSYVHPRQRPDDEIDYLLTHSASPDPDSFDRLTGTYAGTRAGPLRFFRDGKDLMLHTMRSDTLTTLIPMSDHEFAHPHRVKRYTFTKNQELEELDGQNVKRRTRVDDISRSSSDRAALMENAHAIDGIEVAGKTGEYVHEHGSSLQIRLDRGILKYESEQGLTLTLVPIGADEFAALELKETTFTFTQSGDRMTLELFRSYAHPHRSTWTKA